MGTEKDADKTSRYPANLIETAEILLLLWVLSPIMLLFALIYPKDATWNELVHGALGTGLMVLLYLAGVGHV